MVVHIIFASSSVPSVTYTNVMDRGVSLEPLVVGLLVVLFFV